MKVSRPGRQEAMEILRIYFSPDVPLDEDLVDVHHGDRQSVCDDMLGQVIERVFQRNNENRVLSVRLRNGKREVLYRSDLLSGAVLAGIVRRAKERAIERAIEGHGNERAGVRTEDLLASLDDEFHEGEILPPDNSAEEWLKLLDHHPDQVVGISSFRKGSVSEERVVQNIV